MYFYLTNQVLCKWCEQFVSLSCKFVKILLSTGCQFAVGIQKIYNFLPLFFV